MLIAISSFGESLRRAPLQQIPAESWHLKCALAKDFQGSRSRLYDSMIGKTTVKVLPTSTVESTQIRPL
jgi:hypothetical protein